jgi:hypothetical protein
MKTLIASLVFASLLASPAFAQSYDPDLGTGNIVSWSDSARDAPQRGHAGVARVPGGAGSATTAYGAVTPFGAPVQGQNGRNHSSTAREQALRECSAGAAPYKQTTWGNMEIHQYRICMVQHGQAE